MHHAGRLVGLALLLGWSISPAQAGDRKPLEGVRRVVFLGDSITYSGQYIEDLEACMRLHDPGVRCEFLDLGLPSETASGLSEPGHAEGEFARPDLHERLDRVLVKAKPDLIVACYGMNDGIYYPYSDERFEKFRGGIRSLRAKASESGARVLHVTPPVFDPAPIKAKTLPAGLAEYRRPYVDYDEVLSLYAAWLLAERGEGWDVVDVHGPMQRFLDDGRARDPAFRLAGDGIHIDAAGHWLITREILKHWGVSAQELDQARSVEEFLEPQPHGLEALKLIQKKQRALKDSWLTETGHRRPGMKKGLPLEEAEREAARIDAEIGKLLSPKR
jgi:lysophospholipase L1-like esterase